MRRALKVIGSSVAAAAGFYGGYVAVTYLRFGRAWSKAGTNPPLDRLIPGYEVRERHLHLQVMDNPDPLTARLVPLRVRRYERWVRNAWQAVGSAMPAGGDRIRLLP